MRRETNLLRDDPWRRPDWRADRTYHLVERRLRPKLGLDDSFVRRYRRYLIDYEAGNGRPGRQQATIQAFPHIQRVHRLYYAPENRVRIWLEAALLTGEPVADTAARFGVEPKIIEWYEALFYDVRNRLRNRYWVAAVLLSAGNEGPGPEHILKSFAFSGGPKVLDVATNSMGTAVRPNTASEVPQWFQAVIRQALSYRAAEAASRLRANQNNEIRLLQLAMRAAEEAAADAPQLNQYEQLMDKVLKNFNWGVAERQLADMDPLMPHFQTTAVEPRAHEWIMLAQGVVPPSLLAAEERSKNGRGKNPPGDLPPSAPK